MKIDQLLPSFSSHDAIGNHVRQAQRALRDAGYESEIYAEIVDPRLAGQARPSSGFPRRPDADRLIIYHGSTHSRMASWVKRVARSGQPIVLDYHNITPSGYYDRWDPGVANRSRLGRRQMQMLAPLVGLGIADSAFNQTELDEWGYPDTQVCPLLVDWSRYDADSVAAASKSATSKSAGDGRRWLFVGRVAPNKCQHDLIAAFAVYRRLFDPDARLGLVGWTTSPRYQRALERLAVDLDVEDSVDIRLDVSFAELLALYRQADVFVCLSEHEGFCVPVVEAMALELPVVAFQAAAVGETVGRGGLLLEDKDPLQVALAANSVLSDDAFRTSLIERGKVRVRDFALEITSKRFVETVEEWLVTR